VIKAIGRAQDSYEAGDTALFTSACNDAIVSAAELTQVATLAGVAALSAADFLLHA